MVRSDDVIEVSAGPGGGSILTYDATLCLKGAAVLFTPLLDLWFRRVGARAMNGLQAALAA